MNKSDIIVVLSKKRYMPAKLAADIVNLIFNGFTNALKNGDRIEIRGFGSFIVREYGAYKGRNPKTGKIASVKPRRLPLFKVSKELRVRVNGG